MGIEEEEEHGGSVKKHRGLIVEDDDVVVQLKLDSSFVEADDLDMDIGCSSSSTPSPPTMSSLPILQVATLAHRVSSPPPASSHPPHPRPHAILPTSYMVAFLTMQKGDIESSTSKIENKNIAFTDNFLVKAVGDTSNGRFVDNLENVKTGDGSNILSSLSLGVVEVGRNGDDSIGDGASKISLGSLLHFEEDHEEISSGD